METAPELNFTKIITQVKKKKELRHIDNAVVEEYVNKVLRRQPKLVKALAKKKKQVSETVFLRSNALKALIKIVRADLRDVYGVFLLKGFAKKDKLLQEIRGASLKKKQACAQQLLHVHRSSKERLPYYGEIYHHLFAQIPPPSKILDLGCGLNPCSYYLLGCHPTYLAGELMQNDVDFLNAFFAAANLNGKAFRMDLTKQNDLDDLPEAEVVFLFKTLDSLETTKKGSSYALLKALAGRTLVVSFPKMSLGAKKRIETKKRSWFFNFLDQQGWSYRSFEIPNELFIIVTTTLQ